MKSETKTIKPNAWKKSHAVGYHRIEGESGLYLRVAPSGQRTWVYRSVAGGKSSWLRLEDVQDPVTGRGWEYEQAKARAADLRIEAANRRRSGADTINPVVAQRAAEQARREAEARANALTIARAKEREKAEALRPTLDGIAAKYLGVFVAAKRRREGAKRSKDVEQRIYDRDIGPHIGQMKVEDIKTKHISGLRDLIASESGKRHALRLLSALLSHAKSDGLIEFNPARGVATSTSRQRERVLTADECKAIWTAQAVVGEKDPEDKTAVEGIRATMLAAIKVQLATGQRAGEVLAMRRSDLREQDGERWWVVPAEIAKNGKEHLVPMAPQVWALIDAQPRENDLVFAPHRAKGRVSTSAYAQVVDRLRAELKLAHFTSHDLRRTCATKMAEAGTLPHVIEAVLNHSSGVISGVAGIYNRSTYFKEKRDALRKWAKALVGYASGQGGGVSVKVVDIATARAKA